MTDDDIKPFLARVKAKLDKSYSFEQAMRVGLKAVLVSPDFLFLREKAKRRQRSTTSPSPAGSRISCGARCRTRNCSHSPSRTSCTSRTCFASRSSGCCSDPKAAAFTENFAGQWLSLRAIDATMPDRTLYPEYDDMLKVSMVKETALFFDEVLKNDLSLTNFVASDFTMLNGRLAKHYGIPGVEGHGVPQGDAAAGQPSRRSADDGQRAEGDGQRHHDLAVMRGAWVLDRILGTPPPKPPPDVEAIEPDIRGATTIREQLAKHRTGRELRELPREDRSAGLRAGELRRHRRLARPLPQPSATASRRRQRPQSAYLNGPAVDPADVLPDGRRFHEHRRIQATAAEDKDQLARALAEKLLTYATGAAPTTADKPEIEAIVEPRPRQELRLPLAGPRDRAEQAVSEQITSEPELP